MQLIMEPWKEKVKGIHSGEGIFYVSIFGGGSGSIYEVLATGGSNMLGGIDFDVHMPLHTTLHSNNLKEVIVSFYFY